MAAVYPPCDIYVMVGEPGDAYAADLVREIQRQQPSLRIAATGCSALRATGIDIDQDMSAYAVGLRGRGEAIGEFKRLGKDGAYYPSTTAKVLITVDYPGFNLRLLKSFVWVSGTSFVILLRDIGLEATKGQENCSIGR